MGYLQNNYRSRLYRLYILNSTMMLNVTWNMARMFLEEVTQQKIVFVKGAVRAAVKGARWAWSSRA